MLLVFVCCLVVCSGQEDDVIDLDMEDDSADTSPSLTLPTRPLSDRLYFLELTVGALSNLAQVLTFRCRISSIQ